MKHRKIIAVITALTMILGAFSVSYAAEETDNSVPANSAVSFTDLQDYQGADHWAKAAIEKWSQFGIINGYEGLFRPDDSITRGEMAVILDNMMDYQVAAQNTFWDLPAGAFYTDAVLKANAAGIIMGYDGSVRPTEKITKEEAAVIMSRAFAVAEADKTKALLDAAAISDWAQKAVFGLEAKGYVKGFEGNFNPRNNTTRAEVVTMINNIVKEYYTAAGTYTEDVAGNAVIKAAGVVINDAVIKGSVIVAEGVADGTVTFGGKTTVEGLLIVRGGGENSVVITGDASIQSVKVEKVGGKVRIFADGVVIKEVDASEEVILEGSFTNVTVTADAAVVIKGDVAKLDLKEDSKVDIQSGTVTTLNIPAGATASIASGATVKTAIVTGEAKISGAGKIDTAKISGTGATIEQKPGKTVVESGGSANVGGQDVTGTPSGGGGGGGNDDDTPSPTLTLDEDSVTIGGYPVTKSGIYYLIDKDWTSNTAISAVVSGANFDPATPYPMKVRAVGTEGLAVEFNYSVTGSAMNVTNKEITALNLIDNLTGANLIDDVNDMVELWMGRAELNDTILVTIQNGSTTLFTLNLKVVNLP